jgi:hypothetical protein
MPSSTSSSCPAKGVATKVDVGVAGKNGKAVVETLNALVAGKFVQGACSVACERRQGNFDQMRKRCEARCNAMRAAVRRRKPRRLRLLGGKLMEELPCIGGNFTALQKQPIKRVKADGRRVARPGAVCRGARLILLPDMPGP